VKPVRVKYEFAMSEFGSVSDMPWVLVNDWLAPVPFAPALKVIV
jgi:hypothetical protein